jgi:hypothetical protein
VFWGVAYPQDGSTLPYGPSELTFFIHTLSGLISAEITQYNQSAKSGTKSQAQVIS